jgi:hypothetical protein
MADNPRRLEVFSSGLGRLPKAQKHWGSGLPLPPVDSLLPATNQEVARSSRAGRTKILHIRHLADQEAWRHATCDPLASLFGQFLNERIYLKAVTPKTRAWYECAWEGVRGLAGGPRRWRHHQGLSKSLRRGTARPRRAARLRQHLSPGETRSPSGFTMRAIRRNACGSRCSRPRSGS